MNKAELILLVLYRLAGRDNKSISYEDLVVGAFEAYPEKFGLRGYAQYPDASDIHKQIYSTLKPKGFVRVAQKTFQLTEAGRQRAKELGAEGGRRSSVPRRLTRAETQLVQNCLRSSAVELGNRFLYRGWLFSEESWRFWCS